MLSSCRRIVFLWIFRASVACVFTLATVPLLRILYVENIPTPVVKNRAVWQAGPLSRATFSHSPGLFVHTGFPVAFVTMRWSPLEYQSMGIFSLRQDVVWAPTKGHYHLQVLLPKIFRSPVNQRHFTYPQEVKWFWVPATVSVAMNLALLRAFEALWVATWRARARRSGMCSKCNYQLQAGNLKLTMCPECGMSSRP